MPGSGATEHSPLLGEISHDGADGPVSKSNGSVQDDQDDVETNQRTEDAEDPEIQQSRRRVKSVLPILSVGIFLAFLDQSIVAAINGEIGSDLHAFRNVSWIATAYFLTMTAVQPLYGKLSDVFGRKPCLLFAYGVFGLGSLGCSITNSMVGLIAARAVQGIGGGGMIIVVTVLLSDLISLRERGTYQGYLNMIGALGSTSGGPIGGLFVQSIGWRWLFGIQVLLCLAAIISVSLLLHLPKRPSEVSWRKQLPRIDFAGAILLVLTISGLLFGLDRGSNVSWLDSLTLGPICASVPLLIAFLIVETRFAAEPFTPGHIIFDKALFACYIHNFFLYASFTSFIFYLPLFFQIVLEMTPAQAGASLIPAAISCVVGTLIGGIILKRIGKFYWLAVLAAIAAVIGSALFVIAPSLKHGRLASIYVASVIGLLPQGITLTASLIAIISNVSSTDQAVATACSFLFRSLGAAVGVSLIGVLIQNVLRLRLHGSFSPEEANRIAEGVARSLDFIENLPPLVQSIVRDCYGTGIQAGFAMGVALLVLCTLSVLGWREKKLSA